MSPEREDPEFQGGFDFTMEHCGEPMVLFGMRTAYEEEYWVQTRDFVCARKDCLAVAEIKTGVPR